MIETFLEKVGGKNWRTSLTGIGSAIFGLLTALAALPYQLGDMATIIPPEYKAKLFMFSAIAAVVLRIWNSILQRDKDVSSVDMGIQTVKSKASATEVVVDKPEKKKP